MSEVQEGLDGDDRAGMTIYIGAPGSDFRIRIYDKAKEQFKRGEEGYYQHWVRLEIVMRGDNAQGFLGCLANTDNLGVIASGILNDKIAFIERDDSNISRCSFCSWWVDFLESLETIKLVSKIRPEAAPPACFDSSELNNNDYFVDVGVIHFCCRSWSS